MVSVWAIKEVAVRYGIAASECFTATWSLTSKGRFCADVALSPELVGREDFDENFEPRNPQKLRAVHAWCSIKKLAGELGMTFGDCFDGEYMLTKQGRCLVCVIASEGRITLADYDADYKPLDSAAMTAFYMRYLPISMHP